MASGTGLAIGKFTVAVPNIIKDKPASFINCVAFGKRAEVIAERLGKGSPIAVVGHLQTGSYTNKADIKVYTTDVILDSFNFLGSKSDNSEITPTDDDSPF